MNTVKKIRKLKELGAHPLVGVFAYQSNNALIFTTTLLEKEILNYPEADRLLFAITKSMQEFIDNIRSKSIPLPLPPKNNN